MRLRCRACASRSMRRSDSWTLKRTPGLPCPRPAGRRHVLRLCFSAPRAAVAAPTEWDRADADARRLKSASTRDCWSRTPPTTPPGRGSARGGLYGSLRGIRGLAPPPPGRPRDARGASDTAGAFCDGRILVKTRTRRIGTGPPAASSGQRNSASIFSAGVLHWRVCLGRPLSSAAIWSSSTWLRAAKSNLRGRY